MNYSCSGLKTHKTYPRQDIQFNSLVLTGYGQYGYNRNRMDAYLAELKELNLNTASFLYTCFVKTVKDSGVNCYGPDSPSLESLAYGIDKAKELGFAVNARFYVDVLDGTWRCHLNPKNKSEFFKNLSRELTSFGRFLEKRNVELFVIGAEYCSIIGKKYRTPWVNLINNIKTEFKGKLTYGANWGVVNSKIGYKEVSFWDQLDYIGIDHYRNIPPHIIGKDIKDFQRIHFEQYLKLAKKYQKEIIFTEFGFPGVDKGTRIPWEWRNKGKSNETEQASAYKHSLNAIKNTPNIKGVFIWRKLAQNVDQMNKYNPNETAYELYKREAWYEIKKHFNRK